MLRQPLQGASPSLSRRGILQPNPPTWRSARGRSHALLACRCLGAIGRAGREI